MSDLKASRADIRHAYRLLLGREPDRNGYKSHIKQLRQGSLSPTDLAAQFFGSVEFISRFGCLVKIQRGKLPPPSLAPLRCQACTQQQIESSPFLYWAQRLSERPGALQRKLWEWCFATQAFFERGVLQPGMRGLGFAVGNEPLAALFASMNCQILATDLGRAQARKGGWVDSNQHATSIDQLNGRGLCGADEFQKQVRFREVDMRQIPPNLRNFDFLWSSCALEHLGSLRYGMDFVVSAMDCLRPGGIAVHTTELNCDSETETIETGKSVIYRKSDLLELAESLRGLGHSVEPFDFYTGETEADRYVDEFPYHGKTHIKLRIGPYASTSFGLIITKSIDPGMLAAQ